MRKKEPVVLTLVKRCLGRDQRVGQRGRIFVLDNGDHELHWSPPDEAGAR